MIILEIIRVTMVPVIFKSVKSIDTFCAFTRGKFKGRSVSSSVGFWHRLCENALIIDKVLYYRLCKPDDILRCSYSSKKGGSTNPFTQIDFVDGGLRWSI